MRGAGRGARTSDIGHKRDQVDTELTLLSANDFDVRSTYVSHGTGTNIRPRNLWGDTVPIERLVCLKVLVFLSCGMSFDLFSRAPFDVVGNLFLDTRA